MRSHIRIYPRGLYNLTQSILDSIGISDYKSPILSAFPHSYSAGVHDGLNLSEGISSASSGGPEVLFEDLFDQQTTGLTCNTDVAPIGWYGWHTQGALSATIGGVFHYTGEVSAPGRGGAGKGMKCWRVDGADIGDYTGSLGYVPPAGHSHIFMRYYQKIPVAMTMNDWYDVKSWRWNIGSDELYCWWYNPGGTGAMPTNGSFGLTDTVIEGSVTLLDSAALAAVWDGNWHCYEFEVDTVNHTIRFWLDGTLKYETVDTNLSLSGTFTMLQHIPIGNTYDHGTAGYPSTWQAVEFDDFVLATSYVGPDYVIP